MGAGTSIHNALGTIDYSAILTSLADSAKSDNLFSDALTKSCPFRLNEQLDPQIINNIAKERTGDLENVLVRCVEYIEQLSDKKEYENSDYNKFSFCALLFTTCLTVFVKNPQFVKSFAMFVLPTQVYREKMKMLEKQVKGERKSKNSDYSDSSEEDEEEDEKPKKKGKKSKKEESSESETDEEKPVKKQKKGKKASDSESESEDEKPKKKNKKVENEKQKKKGKKVDDSEEEDEKPKKQIKKRGKREESDSDDEDETKKKQSKKEKPTKTQQKKNKKEESDSEDEKPLKKQVKKGKKEESDDEENEAKKKQSKKAKVEEKTTKTQKKKNKKEDSDSEEEKPLKKAKKQKKEETDSDSEDEKPAKKASKKAKKVEDDSDDEKPVKKQKKGKKADDESDSEEEKQAKKQKKEEPKKKNVKKDESDSEEEPIKKKGKKVDDSDDSDSDDNKKVKKQNKKNKKVDSDSEDEKPKKKNAKKGKKVDSDTEDESEEEKPKKKKGRKVDSDSSESDDSSSENENEEEEEEEEIDEEKLLIKQKLEERKAREEKLINVMNNIRDKVSYVSRFSSAMFFLMFKASFSNCDLDGLWIPFSDMNAYAALARYDIIRAVLTIFSMKKIAQTDDKFPKFIMNAIKFPGSLFVRSLCVMMNDYMQRYASKTLKVYHIEMLRNCLSFFSTLVYKDKYITQAISSLDPQLASSAFTGTPVQFELIFEPHQPIAVLALSFLYQIAINNSEFVDCIAKNGSSNLFVYTLVFILQYTLEKTGEISYIHSIIISTLITILTNRNAAKALNTRFAKHMETIYQPHAATFADLVVEVSLHLSINESLVPSVVCLYHMISDVVDDLSVFVTFSLLNLFEKLANRLFEKEKQEKDRRIVEIFMEAIAHALRKCINMRILVIQKAPIFRKLEADKSLKFNDSLVVIIAFLDFAKNKMAKSGKKVMVTDEAYKMFRDTNLDALYKEYDLNFQKHPHVFTGEMKSSWEQWTDALSLRSYEKETKLLEQLKL